MRRHYDDINVTPLIDVLLVLLINPSIASRQSPIRESAIGNRQPAIYPPVFAGAAVPAASLRMPIVTIPTFSTPAPFAASITATMSP